jgi:hypothetical protein
MANTANTKSKTNPAENMTSVIEHRLQSVKKKFPEVITSDWSKQSKKGTF